MLLRSCLNCYRTRLTKSCCLCNEDTHSLHLYLLCILKDQNYNLQSLKHIFVNQSLESHFKRCKICNKAYLKLYRCHKMHIQWFRYYKVHILHFSGRNLRRILCILGRMVCIQNGLWDICLFFEGILFHQHLSTILLYIKCSGFYLYNLHILRLLTHIQGTCWE